MHLIPRMMNIGKHIGENAIKLERNCGIWVGLNVFGYRSIQSGQFICNSGTHIQILARFFS
eukprot:COSAG02_NODE_52966_length_304_cov_1.819512_1_plen_60_part_10